MLEAYKIFKRSKYKLNDVSISVCIASYNAENYISECLSSVFLQDFFSIEIVIVDDMSTDTTRKKILDLIRHNDNITFIGLNKNSGVGVCRNIALKHSCGEYVIALDSDDYIPHDALKTLYDILDKNDVAIGKIAHISQQGKFQGEFGLDLPVNSVSPFDDFKYFHLCTGYHVALLIRRSLIVENKVLYKENTICSSDGFFLFSLLDFVDRVSITNKVTYFYREVEKSIVHKKRTVQYYIDDFFAYEPLFSSAKYDDNFHLRRFLCMLYDFMCGDFIYIVDNFSDEEKKVLLESLVAFFNRYEISKKALNFSIKNNHILLNNVFFIPILYALQGNDKRMLCYLFSLPKLENLSNDIVKFFFLKTFCDKKIPKIAGFFFKFLNRIMR